MPWKEIAFTQNNRYNIVTVKSLEITILYWTFTMSVTGC